MLMAPSTSAAEVFHFPPAEDFPPVDDRLVEPETREEIVRGRRVFAYPADPPHADRHCELDYVIRGHVLPGYVSSSDMLTRPSASSDFATDTSIRKQGTDETTGRRHLEELAFEVVHKQSLRDITERAEELSARGVRRIFAIFVRSSEVKEWSPEQRRWQLLDLDGSISDSCLIRPIRVKALLNAVEADNEVARALLKKNNPVLAQVQEESSREGFDAGRKEGLDAGRKEGLDAGKKQGKALKLSRQFEKRLARTLTDAEHATLIERMDRLGEDRLDDVLLTFTSEAVADWLANPGAR
jgi:hypothetical protein